jgi:hypothetical protein
MMQTILVALAVALVPTLALVPALALAQNTTGTLSPNTSVTRAQAPVTPGTTPAAPGTTTPAATTTTPSAAAAPAPRDVAIVLCAQDFATGTGSLLVFSASTSSGAPTIAPGAPCAQALSDLFVVGFGVIDVLPFNQQLQYTLVR